MTKVVISKKDNKIFEVECDGHTNYGEKGEDIVCASLSSIVQTAVLGLLMIALVELNMKRDDERGYLKFTLPEKKKEWFTQKYSEPLKKLTLVKERMI